MNTFTLENHHIKAVFNDRGALTEFTSKSTNWNIQRRPELALSFIAYLPIPDRRNHQLHGNEQTPAEVTATESSVSFHWKTLTDGGSAGRFALPLEMEEEGRAKHLAEPKSYPIALTLTATLQEDELSCHIEIDNHSDHVLETIAWPCIGDLNRPEASEKMETVIIFAHMLARYEIYPTFRNHKGYFGVDYPLQMSHSWGSPFQLVEAEDQGLYVGYHDAPRTKLLQYILQLKPGYEFADSTSNGTVPKADEIDGQPVHTEYLPTHYPFANPGKSVRLSPLVLAPYTGSWHAGVDHYKAWRATWMNKPDVPEWARHPHSWQQIHINSPEDELRCRYEDLVEYGKEARAHGVAAIQLTGWTRGGQDRANPSHDVDERLGSTEDLRKAIAEIEAMGVKVVLFNKYTWADRCEPDFNETYLPHASKDPYGNAHYYGGYQYQTPTQLGDINTRRFSPMCPLSAEWRKLAVEEFRKSLELGASGMLFDECFHHGIFIDNTYCFDPTHGHDVPGYLFAGDHLLEADFRQAAKEYRDDYLFSGEAVLEHGFETYHVSYFRTGGLGTVPVGRYIDSQSNLMMAIVGHRDRNNVNLALMHRYILSHEPRNFKGRLSEYPETIAYAKKMDAFRTRYREWLWDGEFHHTLGAAVTVDGAPHPHWSRYTNGNGKHAIVICNFNPDNEQIYTLKHDSVETWVRTSPDEPDPSRCHPAEIRIKPQDVAILLESNHS